LTVGRYEAFMTAFVANAVTFAVMAVFTLRVPECPIGIRAAAGRAIPTSTALRDYPYQLVMFVTALFALCWAMLTTGFPLWIRDSTKAPAWMAAAVVFLSSLAISAFQLRVTRYVTTARANRAARIAGFALAASCAVLASASRTTAMCAALLVAVAIILHILGELFFVAVRWRLSIELMDPQYSGSYQGIAYTGESAMLAAGPAVLALVVTAPGTLGWILLTGLFAVAGLATPALHRYAVSHRPVGAGAGTEQATQQ
jgi:hypothetical protein